MLGGGGSKGQGPSWAVGPYKNKNKKKTTTTKKKKKKKASYTNLNIL
jgi:hypothetical protein